MSLGAAIRANGKKNGTKLAPFVFSDSIGGIGSAGVCVFSSGGSGGGRTKRELWQDVTPVNTVKLRIHTPFSPDSAPDSPMDNCISLENDTSLSVGNNLTVGEGSVSANGCSSSRYSVNAQMASESKSKSSSNSTNTNKNTTKRKQRYLPYNRSVKKGSYPLRPGVQGFFITCDGGRERQASHESINVIDSV
ncbi:hypothetical protein TEA_029485 [Camellia sinensis var. sinensis]|uniref:Uncharacterized protein n=1 Tax=Camellia sinensis var. sinensis TaxID=542762 RepID=A0A4S4DLQ3_CAMSN|nr:hypothetical protein TEA_029485 [Camellia sinensis var. sinensis]